MKCNNCNTEVVEGIRFCPNCGSQIETARPKICSQCGKKLEDGEKFCSTCGKPINDVIQPQQVQHQQQYQQPQQMQYHQPYQRQQLHQNPKLSFGEAINIAKQRLQETNGRSRRSEYWWWLLAVSIGSVALSFIPYIGCFVYIAQYFLLYAITLRRLHDCSAPEWVGNMYLGTYALTSLIYTVQSLAAQDVEIAYNIVRWFDNSLSGILIAASVASLVAFIYSIKDSNPEIDPVYGPSPKYTIQ